MQFCLERVAESSHRRYAPAPVTRSSSQLSPGLYDEPITAALDRELEKIAAELKQITDLESHEAPAVFARIVEQRMRAALRGVGGEDALQQQVELTNRVLKLLRVEAPKVVLSEDSVAAPARRLLAVLAPVEPPLRPRALDRPEISLGSSDLLMNSRHDLSVGPEIKREILSADRVDLLCSFLKWSGFRLLEGEINDLLRRRPHGLRVLTTAYMGATERRALDGLAERGAQIKVSYDLTRTRLHAKAWLFHRESGFTTAYVGSSNLSAAAMLEGLEWNVRLSRVDNEAILAKFEAVFTQYWSDPEFRPYQQDEFDKAVQSERKKATAPFLQLDVLPRPHQQEILNELAAERAHGHTRNLVVAATGTGKTVVAALDYKRLSRTLPRSRLLFVAHRREILSQTLSTFRVVMRDGSFGELLVGGEVPVRWEQVFASVQSLSWEKLETISPDHFDLVIIDEFHHAAAPSYERLLRILKPRILVGLTATPERADGKSLLGWFDGRIASETRLWKALDQGLLSPFQYFGVGGAPDLRGVKWSGGGYDLSSLSNLYTADHMFARKVLQELANKVADVQKMKALGFCVDIRHAEFMADIFSKANIAAASVSARTNETDRKSALERLRSGELKIIFSVDLFNEGIDLPDVDTVLFLRPTESVTVFLQQLGRGLRRSDTKECLTVLDFIGNANRKFRFDLRFRAIVGGTRKGIQAEVEARFPSLPAGCAIVLDEQSQQAVLDNIRSSLGLGRKALAEDLRDLAQQQPSPQLGDLLRATDSDLEDVYAGSGHCWTSLKRLAGLTAAGEVQQLERAFSRMLHLDDEDRLQSLMSIVGRKRPPNGDDNDPFQRALFILLGNARAPLENLDTAWRELWSAPEHLDELRQLLAILYDRTRKLTYSLSGLPEPIPLRVHATYSLDEIMALLNLRNSKNGIFRLQAGVYEAKLLRTDLLFVTLEKSEKHYSPTTLYKDYPLSPRRFHWETQSSSHQNAPTGRRYLTAVRGADHNVLMFVRQRPKDDRGETMPYQLLGRCFYETHRGARPMQIEWELEHEIPPGLYQEIKVAAG